ncbi:MAG: hypothetical protein LBH25_05470 [Fibromonadaceae bacterium]|nr:hypothetical protein [Fibromonadaceae bacterium]
MNIRELRLKDILIDYQIEEREFEYGDVKGIAEIFGYQIVFFRKQDNLSDTVALSFNEIWEDDGLISLANYVLKYVDIDIMFGDKLSKIRNKYGKADFLDKLYTNMTGYSYLIDAKLFIVFWVKKGRLVGLEIIADKEMANDIFNFRNGIESMVH